MNEKEMSRLRDLQIRATELGVAIAMCQHGELDIAARELSKMMDVNYELDC